ncbi:disulfide bond formation protein B [Legionella fairfieldensis]|uniref:disulfide bond formation protein B n=1 Tax=Legionella fairfieldensis TaxID=45064 RepID=UPI000490CB38|nr:disulfide bond formation protein B [Legionella fairfieldensis]
MTKLTYKYGQIFLAFVSCIVFLCSLYFQYVQHMQPCPLCLMQRLMVFLLLVFYLLGAYVNNLRSRKIIIVSQGIIALGGVFFATRQMWLQSLPANQTPACMPGLEVLIQYFPWQDVLRTLLWGTEDCAEISWQWLGLSMPAWSTLYFLGMLFATLVFLRDLFVVKNK